MNPDPNNPKRKPLVSVEFQTEVDLATGRPERRMFVKMYFDARNSGLLADIGDRRWRTLCALATYMNEDGTCYPSQALIARDLGTTRETVNRRIQELLDYRFQGRAVLTMRKNRIAKPTGGRWANNVYQILPVTGLEIFGQEEDQESAPKPEEKLNEGSVTKPSHRPVYEEPNTGSRHTNQTQDLNKNVNVNDPFEISEGDPEEVEARAEALVLEMLDILNDPHSTGFYRRIARTLPSQVVFRLLSETKEASARGAIRRNRGAYFTDAALRYARDNGYNLDSESTSEAG